MKQNNDYQGMRALGQFLSAGFTMVTAVVVGYFSGSWLDSYFGTKPWLTLVMFLLGTAAGLKSLYDLAFPKKGPE